MRTSMSTNTDFGLTVQSLPPPPPYQEPDPDKSGFDRKKSGYDETTLSNGRVTDGEKHEQSEQLLDSNLDQMVTTV